MKQWLKRIGISILILVLILLLFRVFLKAVYYPTHPSSYSSYILRDDYDPSLDGKKLEILDPPLGGCFNVCGGGEHVTSCRAYSRKFDHCEVECYGYVYNNCSSSGVGLIFALLTR